MCQLSYANFLASYNLNYSESKDDSSLDHETKRVFHKLFFAGSTNKNETIFLGWNIKNTRHIRKDMGVEVKHTTQEMGPKLTVFTSSDYNFYLTAEWNPFVTGKRSITSATQNLRGNSYGSGLGYLFKISRAFRIGASLNYHTIQFDESTINGSKEDISDKFSHIMPTLELTYITF